MWRLLPVLVVVLVAGLALGQTRPDDAPIEAEATDPMERLAFMVGDWQGQGWIQMGEAPRRTFTGSEQVRARLDGTVIVVEGRHTTRVPPDDRELIVHHAMAVVSHDSAAGHYRFHTWQADGRYQEATATFDQGILTWGFHDEQRAVTVRFNIELTEAGHWFEVGEASVDGTTWHTFFEMTMEPVSPGE